MELYEKYAGIPTDNYNNVISFKAVWMKYFLKEIVFKFSLFGLYIFSVSPHRAGVLYFIKIYFKFLQDAIIA